MPTYAFGVDYDLKSDANLCFSKLGVFRVDYDLKSDSNFYFGNEVLWFFNLKSLPSDIEEDCAVGFPLLRL